jgi:hypothetical protein
VHRPSSRAVGLATCPARNSSHTWSIASGRQPLVIAMPHNNTSRHRIKEVLRRRLETAGMSGCVGHVVPANVLLGYTFSLSGGCGVTVSSPSRVAACALPWVWLVLAVGFQAADLHVEIPVGYPLGQQAKQGSEHACLLQ